MAVPTRAVKLATRVEGEQQPAHPPLVNAESTWVAQLGSVTMEGTEAK